jgi:hypothetical protein
MGNKAPDDTVIPLCDGHHDAYHDGGEPFDSWGKASIREWAQAEIAKARAAWDALMDDQRSYWARNASQLRRRVRTSG